MYVPHHFKETRNEVLSDLIRQNPFGMLVTNGLNGLDVNHLPFDLENTDGQTQRLTTHVARANPMWKCMQDGDKVIVVFQGPDAYISPNWFPSKHEFHKQVPTWNYIVVHAYGRIKIQDNIDFVREQVTKLTNTHEANQPTPWSLSDSHQDYIDAMLKGIVGIEIEITELIGKSKLSQNKDDRDIKNAGNTLTEQGNSALGNAMLDLVK